MDHRFANYGSVGMHAVLKGAHPLDYALEMALSLKQASKGIKALDEENQ